MAITKANKAMCQVAKEFARELRYKEINIKTLNARDSNFWGNVAIAFESKKPVQVQTVLYKPEINEEEYKDRRKPKIEIDMNWGNPRLAIDLPDGTFACVTYKDGVMSDAQAFGDRGLEFALEMKNRIDRRLNK